MGSRLQFYRDSNCCWPPCSYRHYLGSGLRRRPHVLIDRYCCDQCHAFEIRPEIKRSRNKKTLAGVLYKDIRTPTDFREKTGLHHFNLDLISRTISDSNS
ncbi:protein of unknown function [Petrocella atlantisensis]|uniref:Uncharacterized protein n=1 Tax=Petrocella atlantisensis TaxID=2173034 RepID=A0A3P7PT20_9FIRM|nr:protein of unknown function [Petrocella atlantisensis]